jgi:hypothetical protein
VPEPEPRDAAGELQPLRARQEVPVGVVGLEAEAVERRPAGRRAGGAQVALGHAQAHGGERVGARAAGRGVELHVDAARRVGLVERALRGEQVAGAHRVARAQPRRAAHHALGHAGRPAARALALEHHLARRA